MNLTALLAEFSSRGFDYVSSSRATDFLNRAYHELNEMHPWPFLETTSTGSSPLAITDLRAILSVTDVTNDQELFGTTRQEILGSDPGANDTGSPTCWYLDNLTVTPWPTTSVSLSVRYLKVPADLASGSDTPVIPTRYQQLIIDGAVERAHKDSDNLDSAAALRQSWNDEVTQMASVELHRNYMNERSLVQTGALFDYNC